MDWRTRISRISLEAELGGFVESMKFEKRNGYYHKTLPFSVTGAQFFARLVLPAQPEPQEGLWPTDLTKPYDTVLNLIEITGQKGAVTPIHYHNQVEMVFVTEGELDLIKIDGTGQRQVSRLKAKESITVPAGIPHAIEAPGDVNLIAGWTPAHPLELSVCSSK